MPKRIVHICVVSLLLMAGFVVSSRAQSPEFPPDPGVVYVPPTVTIMGQEVEVTDPEDSTVVLDQVDVFGDSTVIYDTQENTLTISGADMSVGDTMQVAISYTGTDTLIIILVDSSTIFADTVISSTSDIIITGEGKMVAEGTVPIIGANTASITFDSVTMLVRSVPGPQALRRRIRRGKMLDETGGPALSGFASASFNKTSVTPPEAEYGEVQTEEAWGGPSGKTNALYVEDDQGEQIVLTEFTLTAEGMMQEGVTNTRAYRALDPSKPMYSILGLKVDASYKGLIIQEGYTYMLINNK